MTSLLEAAKAVMKSWDYNYPVPWEALRAAIEAEEQKPKVERVCLCTTHGSDGAWCGIHGLDEKFDGWDLYVERAVPTKSKAEELAERVDTVRRMNMISGPDDAVLREAAKLLREMKP